MARKPRPFRLTAPAELETPLHVQILGVLRQVAPPGYTVFHVPNGIEASAKAWNRVAQLGALAGFPDLAVVGKGRIWTVEVKTRDGRETQAQRDCAALLEAAEVPRVVARTPREALVWLRANGAPFRIHTTADYLP